MNKQCKWCDSPFEARRAVEAFCSAACRGKYGNAFRKEGTADADYWSVTTPYGAHGFDGWVKRSMEHSHAVP